MTRSRYLSPWPTRIACVGEVLRTERVEILDDPKKSVVCMRPLAATEPGKFGGEMMPIAEQIKGDAAKLGAEAIAAGYIPKPE
jgi:hypothetical protein